MVFYKDFLNENAANTATIADTVLCNFLAEVHVATGRIFTNTEDSVRSYFPKSM